MRTRSLPLTAGLLVLAAAVVAAVLLSVAVGTRGLSPGTVLDALFHFDAGNPDHLVVSELRLPRTLAGVLAGVALGLSGAVVQGATRNPLADPGLLGVNAGAALFVVLGISTFGIVSVGGYVWFGFAGAAVAGAVVYGVSSLGRAGATPVKLALAGAAVTAALASVTSALLLTDQTTFDQYRFWQVGSLTGRDAATITQAVPFVVIGVLLALIAARQLNALALGEDVARSLGQNVLLARGVCALAVVVLCGSATAIAGPIAFVGLTVPHAARLITGPDHRWLLPYSALLAPLLLLVSDVVGRVVARPAEVQVGIITALVGAPVFVLLVRRRKVVAV
ncbi:iron chelate uptake ABC transporter family permease subunit [Amycolatopsis sp. OK19-0408]|uniref:Iron chelate uptake ABC transporter family permease subunit n=1 Tax=Amycolatopsis iheyensis TaxID=2945988 RepID=A0A9X2SL83_9PSEU|nr:iron chelate uptake ABC transporter family permease subunit [Amycolatopsis iheyensis]MCR6484601.1 iron chelate uptake ABC transporter family permease subunit [Amycolatopsis iheyensis]